MPEFLQIVSALKEQMSASLSRSDALRPLSWLIGILILSFFACLYEKPDTWVFAADVTAIGLILAVYAIVYVFFAVKNPDALRSERYTLNKMAIQHGWRGDSLTGPLDDEDPKRVGSTKVIGFKGESDD